MREVKININDVSGGFVGVEKEETIVASLNTL
jgi:hypothetical protein